MDTNNSFEPSFYTLSTNQTDEEKSNSTNITSPLNNSPSRTHDTSGSDHHLQDFATFVNALDQSARRAFPNLTQSHSRYQKIQVLLLRWEHDDLNVEPELADLCRVFEKYNFDVETWLIPTMNAHRRLILKAGEFVDKHESNDCLMIVYYGGHAFINEARQSTWTCTRTKQSASVDWSAVQTLFESAIADVLLLLDCCAAASSAPKNGAALTETIAACGWESIAAEPGRFSFTSALIEVLEEWINRRFSVAMLHSKILSVLKHERPELLGGTRRVECRRTPIYIVTTEQLEVPSIVLSRIVSSSRSYAPSRSSKHGRDDSQEPEDDHRGKSLRRSKRRGQFAKDHTSQSSKAVDMLENQSISIAPGQPEETVESSQTAPVASIPEEYEVRSLHATMPDGDLKLPHVLISLALVENQVFNTDACSDWLASFPALAQYARVQSVYHSYSTLLIISLPVLVWDLLPASPACSFIAYVQSANVLVKNSVSQGMKSTVTKKAMTPSATHTEVGFSSDNRTFSPGHHVLERPRHRSRTPSVTRSLSARSMSPTSGNSQRFPGDQPSQRSDSIFVLPQRKSTQTSQTAVINPKSIRAITPQEKPRSSSLQFEQMKTPPLGAPPPTKKSRANNPWTPAEEQRLKAMRDAGNSWADIARTFPSRTEGSVKKHWYKDMHYAEFVEDESQSLLNAIKEYEANKWRTIGARLGKPSKACEQYAKEHFAGTL